MTRTVVPVTPVVPAPPVVDDARRRRLLDAALATFARYGFRKTSMEEVARTAGISRQGLYGHYATKEALFREAVRFALESGLTAVSAQLHDTSRPIADRLTGAFDAWIGRYVGLFGADVTDLQEASTQLLGSLLLDHDVLFVDAITKAVRGSGLPAAYKSLGLTARQLADTLNATARGLKYSCRTREEFVERMHVAVRAMCLPLE
jgi:AcrR family transcriptional regulator